MSDARDKATALEAEQLIKNHSINGQDGFVNGFMTSAQYGTLGGDVNKATALGIVEALRLKPFRLPSYAVADLPAASSHTGSLVYVPNGAAGSPIVAFSDGSSWLRVDTRVAVST